MEPLMPLNQEFFERKNLVQLIWLIAENYASNWQQLPFTQKYYALARHVFVRKFCERGHSSCLAMDYMERIKLFYKSNSDGNNIEEIVNLEFLQKIDADFMIIDWFFILLVYNII